MTVKKDRLTRSFGFRNNGLPAVSGGKSANAFEPFAVSIIAVWKSIIHGKILHILKLFDHHFCCLVDIAAAERDYNIAALCVFDNVVRNFLKGVEPDTSGYLIGKILCVNIIGISFSRTHDFGHNKAVGNPENTDKIVKQNLGS